MMKMIGEYTVTALLLKMFALIVNCIARARKIACTRVGVITSDYDSDSDKHEPITRATHNESIPRC